MIEFNSSERRAVRGVAVLVVLAGAARLTVGPDPGHLAWEGSPPDRPLAAMRTAVDSALAVELVASRPLQPGERIDLNTAEVPELRRLPGVGPARAVSIRQERDRRSFASVEELVRVPGIGDVTAQRLAPYLAVEPAGAGVLTAPRAAPTHRPGECSRPRFDVNQADPSELETLPGVGPARAAAIVEHRRRGGFATLRELEQVSGIGPVTVDRIVAFLCDAIRDDGGSG